MGAEPSPGGRPPPEILASMARWLLGGLFIYLGVSKILHPAEFLTFVRQQMSVTNPSLAGLIAGVAPWLEVLYGMWLISGIARNTAALLGRWWLGAVFIYMGLNKALPNPEAFLKLVRQYQIVDTPVLLNSIAAALPWFEVYCGVLLLAGVAVRGTALNLIAMLVPFTVVVLKRALAIAAATGKPFCAVEVRLRLRGRRGLHLPQAHRKFGAPSARSLALDVPGPAALPSIQPAAGGGSGHTSPARTSGKVAQAHCGPVAWTTGPRAHLGTARRSRASLQLAGVRASFQLARGAAHHGPGIANCQL